MNLFDMNAVGAAFLWCVIQVTLFAAVGLTVHSLARRLSLRSGAAVVNVSALIVLALSAMVLSPWPNWTPIASKADHPPTQVAPAETDVTDTVPSTRLAQNAQTPADRAPIGSEGGAPESDEAAPDGGAIPWALLARALWEELHEMPAGPVASGATTVAGPIWTWRAFLGIALLSATMLGALWLLAGWVAVNRLRRRSHPLHDAELTELVDVLQAELGCTRPVTLHESSALGTAATVGWRRPVILLPPQWRGWSRLERRTVLAHELAHIRRADHLTYLLARVGLAIHFYHPLVHWLLGRLRLEQELAVDADAAEVLGGRRPYLATLAELALAQPNYRLGWPARAFVPTHGMFLRRIDMLRNKRQLEDSTSTQARLARWCTVSVLVLAGVAAAGLRGAAANAKQGPGGLSDDTGAANDKPPRDDSVAGRGVTAEPRPLGSVVWDKPRGGWQAGARLLSTSDQFQVGDPVVVQYLLKNVTTRSRTFVLMQIRETHPTLGGDNRINLNMSGSRAERNQHTLAAGAVMEKRQYRITLDTRGMMPGVYTLDSRPAFWEAEKDQPTSATGIGRYLPIRFRLEDPARKAACVYAKPPPAKNAAEKIHWGKRVGGLIVGMRLPKGRTQWTNESRIEGELFIYNVSQETIDLTYKVPRRGEWNMHVQTKEGKDVRLGRVRTTGFRKVVTESLTIKPGEQVCLTDRRRFHGPVLQVAKAAKGMKPGRPARLITRQGSYVWRAYITVNQKKAPRLTMVIGSGPVPLEIAPAEKPAGGTG